MELPGDEPSNQTSSEPKETPSGSFASRFVNKFWHKDNSSSSSSNSTPPSSSQNSKEEEVHDYEEYAKKAKATDFSKEEVFLKKFIYVAGSDNGGRTLVIVVGKELPKTSLQNPEHLLMYVIKVMDEVVKNDYALIYIHTNVSSENRPSFAFLRKAYRILSRNYKKNLKSLYIVQPSFWIRTTFKFFKPFISNKFWQKLIYINEINEIFKFISRESVSLPDFVFENSGTTSGKRDAVFGVPLEDVLDRPDHEGSDIPIVIHKCIEYFKEKDVSKVQGIFRLSAGSAVIQQLKKDFDKGEDVNLNTIEDPHVVAGLFKLYFRELPTPLIPYDHFKKLIEAYKNKEKQLEEFQAIFDELPAENKALLKAVLEVLNSVVENAESNKMNSSNLSIVFAPNLIRPPPEEAAQLAMYTPIINSIMRSIIDLGAQLAPKL